MNQLLVGYARVSTEQQDLTAQRNSLAALGVGDDRIYVDYADHRVMPTWSRNRRLAKETGTERSA